MGSRPDGNKTSNFQVLPLDPAVYYGRVTSKKKFKNTNNINRKNTEETLSGSLSQSTKKNNLRYAFLQPETPPDGGGSETCRPPSGIGAFTFMNFALAAISLAANLVIKPIRLYFTKVIKKNFLMF